MPNYVAIVGRRNRNTCKKRFVYMVAKLDGTPVYIGSSVNPAARIAAHISFARRNVGSRTAITAFHRALLFCMIKKIPLRLEAVATSRCDFSGIVGIENEWIKKVRPIGNRHGIPGHKRVSRRPLKRIPHALPGYAGMSCTEIAESLGLSKLNSNRC